METADLDPKPQDAEWSAKDLATLNEGLRAVRRELADLRKRVARLEIRDELLEAPGSAGDERLRI